MAAGDITYGISNAASDVATDIAAAVTVAGSAGEKIVVVKEGQSFHWWHVVGA